MEARLEQYIQDHKIPDDIVDYFPDGDMAQFCVFCGMEHNNIPFTHSDESLEQNTFKCSDCSRILDENLIGGQKEMHFMTYKEKLLNLNAYRSGGILTIDKLQYLPGGKMDGHCIFCDTAYIGVPWMLNLVVGDSLYFYGGEVAVCDSCYNWTVNQHVSLDNHESGFIDKCHTCRTLYSVTEELWKERDLLNTLSKHECSQCFYSRDIKPGDSIIESIECDVCGKSLRNDLTHVFENPCNIFSPRIYCPDCSLASFDKYNEVIIKHTEKDVYININLVTSEYAILYLNRKIGEMQVIASIENVYKNPKAEMLAYLASTRIHELLKEGKIPRQDKQGLIF